MLRFNALFKPPKPFSLLQQTANLKPIQMIISKTKLLILHIRLLVMLSHK